jgi:hypothetical protein
MHLAYACRLSLPVDWLGGTGASSSLVRNVLRPNVQAPRVGVHTVVLVCYARDRLTDKIAALLSSAIAHEYAGSGDRERGGLVLLQQRFILPFWR